MAWLMLRSHDFCVSTFKAAKCQTWNRSVATAKSACIIDYTVPIFLTRAVISLQMGHYFLKLICKLNLEIPLTVSKEVSSLYGHYKQEYMTAIIIGSYTATSFFIFELLQYFPVTHNLERNNKTNYFVYCLFVCFYLFKSLKLKKLQLENIRKH